MRRIVRSGVAGVVALAAAGAASYIWGASPDSTGAPAQMVITVQPARTGGAVPGDLQKHDVNVLQGRTPLTVTNLQRLTGDLANMQLFLYLDDSTRSSSLGLHIPELQELLRALPASTQVAVGYMRNGTFALTQSFTANHEAAVKGLRLPAAMPGENGSPYFALSDLVKHWPSKETTGRRAVLMLTDGVDRYYGSGIVEDPYVDAAIHDSLKNGVAVYSIFVRGAGLYGRSAWATNFAQSRLDEVSRQTGGNAYFQNFSDPVTIQPFLKDFRERLEHQYRVTFEAMNGRGIQEVKVQSELPGVKIDYPSRVYVR